MTASQQGRGALDWNQILPSVAATHRKDLHLDCGDCVIFYCPDRGVGLLWRRGHDIAQLTAPITALEFVRAVVARGVTLPRGEMMTASSSAVTNGRIATADAGRFLQLAHELDQWAAADAACDGDLH